MNPKNKRGFYFLDPGQSCIVPYNNKDKCYNRRRIQELWNKLYQYGKQSGKKFTTRKHIAGIEVTRIL